MTSIQRLAKGLCGEEFGADAEDVDVAIFGELGHVGDVEGVGGEPVVPAVGGDDAAPILGTGLIEQDDRHEHDVHAAGLGMAEDANNVLFRGDILPIDGDRFGFFVQLACGNDEVDPRAAHVGEVIDGFEIVVASLRIAELNGESPDLVQRMKLRCRLRAPHW